MNDKGAMNKSNVEEGKIKKNNIKPNIIAKHESAKHFRGGLPTPCRGGSRNQKIWTLLSI